MFTKTSIIDPKTAQEWLDTKNVANRPLSKRTVDKYAQEMKAGRWKLNGEAIIFGTSGNLMNGQHRLAACVKAERDFTTLVTFGVEDSAFDTLDDNNPRKLRDVLAIGGEVNPNFLSSALYFVYAYANGTFRDRAMNGKKKIATKKVLEQMLVSQPGLRNSTNYFASLRRRPGGMMLPPSLAIGLHYIFSLVDEVKANEFFDQLQSGLELKESSPVYLLRQRLIAGAKERSVKLQTEAQYAYTVMAWNAFVVGRKLGRMQMPNPDVPLPEIEGVPRSLMKDLL
jgi:hypothetical protein